MSRFESFLAVDWSAANDTGAKPRADAIWIGAVIDGVEIEPTYRRNRPDAIGWISGLLTSELNAGRRVAVGCDFPFGYPEGFAEAITGGPDPLRLWQFYRRELRDSPDRNDRFALAGRLNAIFPGVGPFWFNAGHDDVPDLPRKASERTDFGLPERRDVERLVPGASTCWQMGGAGAVGGQAMTGMAALERLREKFPDRIAVWPFEPAARPVTLLEIYPSLLAAEVAEEGDEIRDRAQVRVMARAMSRLSHSDWEQMLDVVSPEEGWIFGVGHEERLRTAAGRTLAPPPLSNDCFALPSGIEWTPVDVALSRLRKALSPVAAVEVRRLDDALDRILAAPLTARRANPPAANSAVDGYGFDGRVADRVGPVNLALVEGRAAAGRPFRGRVPEGRAIRILTGALLPDGVDTVVLEEDTTTDGRHIAFNGPVRPGANTRRAGEDIEGGKTIFLPERRIGPADIALMAATGVIRVSVRRPLAVGVLSTGDEVVPAGSTEDPGRTYDANRPMLMAMLRKWKMDARDLGHVGDDRAALRDAFDRAAAETQAILTSGGASAGDEDHVSALLGEAGTRHDWRIALKPGRPLALGVWKGVPVFGLPGNPVAAMVCTLIFARPALGVLAGEGWKTPRAYMLPAAFEKKKRPGRREYLRARLTDVNAVEIFASEGSGRISGLAWADGLVELADGARHIRPGDPVRYLPYSSFGL